MKRNILFIIACLITSTLSSCSKDDEGDALLISAISTIEETDLGKILKTDKISANIAFIKATDFPDNHNKEVISGLINASQFKAIGQFQYKEYLPKGEYVIVMQINDLAYTSLNGIYTFKRISTLNGQASTNIMLFRYDNKSSYQSWVDNPAY